jgi:1-acyl-sn-glycerol-3-phosphate acyltransferase
VTAETLRARRRARRAAARQRRVPATKLAHIGAAGAVLVPAQIAARLVVPRSARPAIPSLFHKIVCQSLGIRVRRHGTPARRHGVLFVSNHLGWVDIPVLGSKLLGSFVAKAEVNGWGVFGYLARLQDTIYVQRERRLEAGEQRNAIAERLRRGGRVILFPEGTNSDGTRVLPFKSALFSVVEGPGTEEFLIQPVTVAYTRVNGMPVNRTTLPQLAWVGDVELGPHLAQFMRLGRIEAHIWLHSPVRRADFPSRKALAAHCQAVVADGYERLMRGELPGAAGAAYSAAA